MLKLTLDDHTYRVRWQHFPVKEGPLRPGTMCEVFRDDEAYGFGESFVHKWDTFEKEMGRRISLGRALKSLGLSPADRHALLSLYEQRG